ncbi:lipid-A-disaccharide synthase N-terminal domain-containing protein [Cellulophaga sp. F20128]|uniref:lipid-A-disaccharide synthase N-terminal domain-containing protein n=1 Tax=Cellulophaga sp. F20128 TaxID=2926413 RepID=UPI001FF55D3D|nr:lipid-A-disaccharide synthase N-terminal domain-containing protein [Cellulophaga sp. F20128]MCK0158719.1 lipid-A-disaccharide synthase N-terminal domain-containing protein [Cellulophaga sp. F20128]
MTETLIYAIGFLAQILFSGRLLSQWILSEKQKKVVTPSLFWKLSLLASFILFIYGWLRHDFAIMLGQILTYYIYIRNLQLQGEWKKWPSLIRAMLWIFPVLIVIYSYNNNQYDISNLFKNDAIPLWLLLLGSIAQVIFTTRFIVQWLHSEKNKTSSLPFSFWLLSLIGSTLILVYAIIRKDPVLFVGHIFGAFVYSRNIFLSKKK